jgi:hypothetical protein
LLEKFINALKDIAKVDQNYRLDSRTMSIILSPNKIAKKPSHPTKSDDSNEKDNTTKDEIIEDDITTDIIAEDSDIINDENDIDEIE